MIYNQTNTKQLAEIFEGIFDQGDLDQSQDLFGVAFKNAIEEHDIKQVYKILCPLGKPITSLQRGDFFIELQKSPTDIQLKTGRIESSMISVLTKFIFVYKTANKIQITGPLYESVKSKDYILPRPMLIKTSKTKINKLIKQLIDIYDL